MELKALSKKFHSISDDYINYVNDLVKKSCSEKTKIYYHKIWFSGIKIKKDWELEITDKKLNLVNRWALWAIIYLSKFLANFFDLEYIWWDEVKNLNSLKSNEFLILEWSMNFKKDEYYNIIKKLAEKYKNNVIYYISDTWYLTDDEIKMQDIFDKIVITSVYMFES